MTYTSFLANCVVEHSFVRTDKLTVKGIEYYNQLAVIDREMTEMLLNVYDFNEEW